MTLTRSTRATAVVFAAVATWMSLSAEPAEAWTRQAYRSMLYDTIRMLPPRLSRLLLSRDEAILRGIVSLEGDTASMLARDARRGQISSELIEDVEARIARVASLVNEHRPIDEMATELGRLLRIAADMADPAVIGAGQPELRQVAAEYYRFVDLNVSKFPLVHNARLPSPVHGASVSSLLAELWSETGVSVSPLAEAFWRNGRLVPAAEFDYRSVPYAETSLCYSRGVTAASYLWLAAWKQANGDFTGYRFGSRKH